MPSPPDIDKPFASTEERNAARVDFLRLGAFIEHVLAASEGASPEAWLSSQLARPLRGFQESPQNRLQRYRSVFAEELEALKGAIHNERLQPLDDASLRAGRYLAQRLLASLLDCTTTELQARLPSA